MSSWVKPEQKALMAAGVEITYTTGEVGTIFRKTRQWVLWSLKEGRFLDADHQPLQIEMVAQQYIWTPANVRDAAISCYQRRRIDITELKRIIRLVIRDTGEINGLY